MFGELSHCPQPLKRRTVKSARNNARARSRLRVNRNAQSSPLEPQEERWRFAKRRGHNRGKIDRAKLASDTSMHPPSLPLPPPPPPLIASSHPRDRMCAHVRVCELPRACARARLPPPPSRIRQRPEFRARGPAGEQPPRRRRKVLTSLPTERKQRVDSSLSPLPPSQPPLPAPSPSRDTRVIASSAITRAACS